MQIVRGQEPLQFVGENAVKCFDFSTFCGRLDIDFRPRSSVWKTGMILSNCEPTIDEGFTGEVSAVFYHVIEELPIYDVGDKIIQMKVGFTFDLSFEETTLERLNSTDRGDNSYGSSGK